jgi:hypothetical protein
MTNLHMNIDYEGVAGSYRAVVVGPTGGAQTRFATGDPVADWTSGMALARTEAADNGFVMTGSNVTHFVMDDDACRFVLNDDGQEVLVPEDRWPLDNAPA